MCPYCRLLNLTSHVLNTVNSFPADLTQDMTIPASILLQKSWTCVPTSILLQKSWTCIPASILLQKPWTCVQTFIQLQQSWTLRVYPCNVSGLFHRSLFCKYCSQLPIKDKDNVSQRETIGILALSVIIFKNTGDNAKYINAKEDFCTQSSLM